MSKFDASIPVLTEVFQDQPAAKALGSSPADLTPTLDAEAGLEAKAIDEPGDAQLRALERRITDRILLQLHPQIERIVADAVAQEIAQLQGLTK